MCQGTTPLRSPRSPLLPLGPNHGHASPFQGERRRGETQTKKSPFASSGHFWLRPCDSALPPSHTGSSGCDTNPGRAFHRALVYLSKDDISAALLRRNVCGGPGARARASCSVALAALPARENVPVMAPASWS